ncbi:MAG TPA: hypothetical protein VEC99_16130, partial [Clostridia bacterium]|nr:hypothetical protein [Clostridia bacterium]
QRNPHARWTTTLEDVKELSQVQQNLLSHAATAVKPGGKLVYAVCTLASPETSAVAQTFEEQFSDFQPLLFDHPLNPSLPPVSRLWLWPQEFGGNGMFVAAWTRKPALK